MEAWFTDHVRMSLSYGVSLMLCHVCIHMFMSHNVALYTVPTCNQASTTGCGLCLLWVVGCTPSVCVGLLCIFLCAGGICWSCVETLSSRTAYTSSHSKLCLLA